MKLLGNRHFLIFGAFFSVNVFLGLMKVDKRVDEVDEG
jgi:hypothetical protein